MKNYTLKEIFVVIWKYILLIVCSGIVLGGLFGFYAKMKQTTTYTATRNILIQHDLKDARTGTQANAKVNADINMMPTYASLVQDGTIIGNVQHTLEKGHDIKISEDELNTSITATPRTDSTVMEIRTDSNSKEKAILITNTTAKEFKKTAPKLDLNIGKITLLATATDNPIRTTTTPSAKKYVVLGVAVGAFFGLLGAFVIDTLKLKK